MAATTYHSGATDEDTLDLALLQFDIFFLIMINEALDMCIHAFSPTQTHKDIIII